MKDTYKGESLGKKLARAWFWCCAEKAVGKRFYTHKHIVLASREGGDVAVLKAMGVHPRNIIAMEINAAAAREFAAANPDIAVRVGDCGRLVNHKDVRGKVVVAHLDFCSWATPTVLATACRVGRFALCDGGVLSVGFMKGRETGDVSDAISHLRECGGDLFKSETPPRATRFVRSWADRAATTRVRAEFLNYALISEFEQPGPIVGVRLMRSVGYDSGRTPMVYCAFRVTRHLTRRSAFLDVARSLHDSATRTLALAWDMAREEAVRREHGERRESLELAACSPEIFCRWNPFREVAAGVAEQMADAEFGEPSAATAVTMAAVLEHYLPLSKPHELLNLRRGRLAAWRANASRGTYGPELAAWMRSRPTLEPWEASEEALAYARDRAEIDRAETSDRRVVATA